MATGLLAGCLDTGTVSRGETSPMWYQSVAPRTVNVAGTGLRLQGPSGYCIDPGLISQDEEAAFYLLGSCASLANTREAGNPRTYAALTASVSKGASGNADGLAEALAAFLPTEAGRASLSRSGDADSVEVLDVQRSGDIVLVRASDSAQAGGAGLREDYWRAFLTVNGHIVTLSVYGLAAKPLSASRGKALAQAFVSSVLAANATVVAVTEKTPDR